MRGIVYSLLLCAASQSLANDAFERLKARYRALEQGQTVLPELTAPAPSQAIEITSSKGIIPSGEELIMSVYLDGYSLGDVLGLKTDQRAAFSLLDIATALDLPLSIGEDSVMVEGWIRSPETPFRLTQEQQEVRVTIGDQHWTVGPDALLNQQELLVSASALEQWLDIEIDLDFQSLTLTIRSDKPLPLQQRIARRQRADNISPLSNIAQYPLSPNTYSPLSRPLVDLQATTAYSELNGSQTYASILGSNDLAYFNTQYYLSASDELGLTGARLLARKTRQQSDLLGPLEASIIELGDIRPTPASQAIYARDSVGLRISNETLGTQGTSTVNLVGEIQPGWDIEIYRNNLLIDSQTNVQGGQYRFDNVPLNFGANSVELVFYGPQGQVERETQNFYIDGTGQQAGDFNYDISLYEDNTELFDSVVNSQLQRPSYGMTVTGFGRYALSDWFSVNVGQTQHLDAEYEALDRQAIGTSTSLFGKALLTTDYVMGSDDSTLTEYGLSTRLFKQAVRYTLTQTDDWTNASLQAPRNREVEKLSVSGLVPDTHLSYQQDILRREEDGQNRLSYRNQLAAGFGPYYVSHQFEWFTDEQPNEGRLQLQRYLNSYFARLGLSYQTEPSWTASGLFAEISGTPYLDIQTQLALSRNIQTNVNDIAFSASWRPNDFTVTSRLAYNDVLGWSTRLSGQISIGQTDDSVFVSNRSLVSQGSIAAFVYLDRNDNGVFDGNDEPLPNIGVISRQSYRKSTTNEQGLAVLSALPNYRQTDIEIDDSTIEEPFLMPRSAGLSVIPRAGTVQQVELPMTPSYEVEGTVYELSSEQSTRKLAYAPVQLIDAQGQVIDEVLSEFDGYYLFTPVAPRQYTIRIAPEYLQSRGYLAQHGRQIALKERQDPILAGTDLYLRKAISRQGYSAKIQTFTSLTALRSYWTLLKARHPQLADQRYYHLLSDEGYTLYIGFSEQPHPAKAVCQTLASLSCDVVQLSRR